MSWLGRFFKTPKKIFVVTGEQLKSYEEPGYSTHPDEYNFPYTRKKFSPQSPVPFPTDLLDHSLGSRRKKGPQVIKVFSNAEDAVNFTCCCNLASVFPSTFEWINKEWVRSNDQSAFDIDW